MIPSISVIRGFVHKYRSLLSLGVAALLAELAYAILNLSAMPVYAKYVLHNESALGFIMPAFLLTEALSRPAFGALGDKIGRKPLLIIGPALTAVTAYITVKIGGPYVIVILVALRALDGLGSGALWPSAFAAIGDIVEEENRSAAMSVLNVTYMGGLALGFLLGGLANRLAGTYTASFYLVSVLLALCVLVMVLFLPRRIGESPHAHDPIHGEPLELPTLEEPSEFKLGHLWRSFREVPEMIALAFFVFMGTGMLMPIIKLYAMDHLGLSEVTFGLAVAPAAALMGIFAVPLGRLGDKYGKCVAVCWGIFASALAMWVLALFRSVVLAGLSGIVLGLGFTVAFPAWMALVSSATAPSRRGEVLGAVGMAQGLAAIVGTAFGAFIYGSDSLSFPRLGVVNYNVPFWFSAILLSIGAVVAFTWVCGEQGVQESAGNVKAWQRRLVVMVAIAGLLALAGWISLRYARPVAPDRVAWQWVQQLYKNRPKKAVKYVAPHRDGWDGIKTSREFARTIHDWRRMYGARYVVRSTGVVTEDRADVPVDFHLKVRGEDVEKSEHVILCRQSSGRWKVCGLYGEK